MIRVIVGIAQDEIAATAQQASNVTTTVVVVDVKHLVASYYRRDATLGGHLADCADAALGIKQCPVALRGQSVETKHVAPACPLALARFASVLKAAGLRLRSVKELHR
jgi:hypothetical protein